MRSAAPSARRSSRSTVAAACCCGRPAPNRCCVSWSRRAKPPLPSAALETSPKRWPRPQRSRIHSIASSHVASRANEFAPTKSLPTPALFVGPNSFGRAGIIARMVAIVHVPLAAADAKAFAAWIDHVAAAYAPAERAAIGKALDSARVRYTGLRTADGEPWLDRALGTAGIVAALKLDADSVRAAILLGAPFAPG